MKRFILVVSLLVAVAFVAGNQAAADHQVGDICRIKGQEENLLHGVGLVVGLKGTGDDSKATLRALARYMELMGHRLGVDAKGQPAFDELKGVKNVAMVTVTATIPPGGAQQGDTLDCVVSALSAKSLEGGQLMLTELHGPLPADKTVYGLAKGAISVDDSARPQVGRILLGCQVEKKFQNEYVKNGKLTLSIHKDHAGFQTAHAIAERINLERDLRSTNWTGSKGVSGDGPARAVDQVTIEVSVPPIYADSPAYFAKLLLDIRLPMPAVDGKVIINEKKKAIIIGESVEIAPVAIMHKNRLIQTGGEPVNEFVAVDPSPKSATTKLNDLVNALNALKIPAEDVIDIIKMLKHKRALYGELIIE